MSQTLSEVLPQVALPETDLPKGSFIAGEDLVPGLIFDYKVRAEKGRFGDFPDMQAAEYAKKQLGRLTMLQRLARIHNPSTELKHQFQLNGHWVIRAGVISAEKSGALTMFNVFEDDSPQEEALMTVTAKILSRPEVILKECDDQENIEPYSKHLQHYGLHPIQAGYGTLLANPVINSYPPKEGMRFVIPARNILAGSLKIIHASANRTA